MSEGNKRFCINESKFDSEDTTAHQQMAFVLLKESRKILKIKSDKTRKARLAEVNELLAYIGYASREKCKDAKWSAGSCLREELRSYRSLLQDKDCCYRKDWEKKEAWFMKELEDLEFDGIRNLTAKQQEERLLLKRTLQEASSDLSEAVVSNEEKKKAKKKAREEYDAFKLEHELSL